MLAASSTSGAHSVDVTRYGSGFKPCRSYIEAREPQSMDTAEFIDWLGGYLSGVNAISLKYNDILGASQLTQAVYWLDEYCSSHPVEPFAVAVGALVDASHRNR